MTDIVKTLSPTEVAAAIADASKISATAVNVASPKTFIFNAGFDGTNNIKTDLSVSQDKQSTAIGALTDAVPDTANSATKYYAGMGTPGTLPGSSVNPIQVTTQAIIEEKQVAATAVKRLCFIGLAYCLLNCPSWVAMSTICSTSSTFNSI